MPSVTVMSVSEVDLIEGNLGREGRLRVKQFPFDSGVPGIEIEFSWNSYDKGYGTPRHRHTFDQYRYALSGRRMIQDGFLEPGECGFYPEGVYYGPQKQEEQTVGLGLQFQGLSGLPYLTHAELRAANKALREEGGTFEEGVYTKIMPDGRKVNKDGHAAAVEYITGQKIEFPEGRFEKPIVMRPQGHPWIGDRVHQGVEHKRLGQFGGSGVRLTRLQPGAVIAPQHEDDAEIRYLIEGTMTYGGKVWVGGKTENEGACMFVQAGADVGEIRSETGGTFFVIELPVLADVAANKAPHFRVARQARAERH